MTALSPLTIIEPEEIRGLGPQDGYEQVILAVDSGASETVLERTVLPTVDLKEGAAKKNGVKCEVANGQILENLGEKTFTALTEEGFGRNLTAQVCDVNKSLLSVSRAVKNNNCVLFHPRGSYIQDLSTGERSWLKEEGGTYHLSLWVPCPN